MTPRQYNEYQRQADVIDEAKKWKEKQDKMINEKITSPIKIKEDDSKTNEGHQE